LLHLTQSASTRTASSKIKESDIGEGIVYRTEQKAFETKSRKEGRVQQDEPGKMYL
jgi:hypothetical protein